jgi:hypothetical protein
MPAWGPVTVTIGPGTHTPDNRGAVLFDTGQQAIGSVTQVSGSGSVTFAGGRSDAVFDNYQEQLDPAGNTVQAGNVIQQRLTAPSFSWQLNVDPVTSRVRISFDGSLYQGQTMTCTAQGTFMTRTPCEHGTQLQQGASFVYYLTPGLIDVWLTKVGMSWLAPLFTGLWFSTINAQTLCQAGPPPMPPINLATLTAGVDTALAVLRVIAWANLCECSAFAGPLSPSGGHAADGVASVPDRQL